MAKKSGSSKKSDNTRGRVDSGEKEKLIAELKKRVAVLENELQLKQGNTTSGEISDRKHAKNGLSRALLDTLLTKAPIGFAFFDRELHYVLINDRLAEINGIPAADHIGKRVHDIVPSLLPTAQKVVDHILATGQPVKDHEFCGETALMPGVMCYWSESWYPVRDGSGEIVGFGAIIEEITERKQAEDALKASEKNAHQRADELEALMDMIPAAVWVSRDPDCQTIVGNKFSNQFTEAEAGENISAGSASGEVYDRTRRFFMNGRELKPEELPMQEAVSKGTEVVNSEIDTLLPSGRHITILGNAKPLRDANGQICGCVSLFIDITERKRMEKALLEQERFRNVFETPLIGAAIGSPEKEWILVNDKICEMLGYTGDELKQLTWDQLTHPDDQKKDVEQFNRLLSGEIDNYTIDKRFIGKDGSIVYTTIYVGAVRKADGTLDYDVSFMLDITERKQAEDTLREGEAKFRALFEGAGVAIFVANVATGRIIDCNKMAEELTGRPRDEIIGLHQTQLHPANKAGVQREQFARHSRGVILDNDDAEVQHRDGRVIPVIIKAASLKVNGQDILIGFFLDITERKRAEEALQESEASLVRAQAIAHIGNWEWDLRKCEGRWSDELYNIFGVDKKSFYPSQENFLSRVHPEDRPHVESSINATYKTGKPYSLNFRIIRPDGTERTLYCEGELAYDKDGKPIKIFGINQDITERKGAEDRILRLNKDLDRRVSELQTLFDLVPISVSISLDKECRQMSANNTFMDLVGMKPGSNISQGAPQDEKPNFKAFLHGKELPLEELPMQKAAATGRPVHGAEFDAVFANGHVINFYGHAAPLFDENGDARGAIGAFDDVTERKRVEDERKRMLESLSQSENQLRALVLNLKSGVTLIDGAGRFVVVNPAFLKMFGLADKSDIMNINNQDWGRWEVYDEDGKLLHVDDHPVRRAAMTGRPEKGRLVAVRNPGAKELTWMLISAEPLRSDDGSVYRVVCTYHDITELKRANDELAEAKSLSELYLDLMGHDINNMHQIALGYLELAREMMPHTDDTQTEFLDKPIEVMQRSAQLIQNVRKLQKLQEGVFQTQAMDMRGLLVDVQREFGAVPHKAITLNMNGCERCHVRANELLHDVFANLVSNAIKHTGDRADITISLEVVESDGSPYCQVSVEDDGPGISDDFKVFIFNRMHRGSARGMGLGLYLVKSLVESYGGRIWVEDRVKGDHTKGARFVVMLPAVDK